jgi:hypothetical protein
VPIAATGGARPRGRLVIVLMAALVLLGVLLCHGHGEETGQPSVETVGAQALEVHHGSAVAHDHSGAGDSHDVPTGPGIPAEHDEPFCGPSEADLSAVQAEPVRSPEPLDVPVAAPRPQAVVGDSRLPAAETAAARPPAGTRLLVLVCVSRR